MLQTMRSGGAQHPEEIMNFLASQLVVTSGIMGKVMGDLAVAQQTVPNMTVKIAIGHALLKKSGAEMAYPVRVTAAENVTIGANSSGNPRKDAIVLYIDLGASPNTDISNVAKAIAVQGTPAASPVAPLDAAIQTAIGASNPFIRLADVAVANGAVSIVTANILDQRAEVFFYQVNPDCWALLSATGVRIDADTMTVPGDVTGFLQKGDKIKLTDTTTKYFYVASVPSFAAGVTSFDIYAGTDSTLVGTPSNIYFSKAENPQGFPAQFNIAARQTMSMRTGGEMTIRGWGFVNGAGAASMQTDAVTFGKAFSARPMLTVGALGGKNASDPTHIGDFTDFGASTSTRVAAIAIATSGFSANIYKGDNTNLNSGLRFGHSFIAIGTL